MVKMHRHIQIHQLIDSVESLIRVKTRAKENALKHNLVGFAATRDIQIIKLKRVLRKAKRRIAGLPLCPADTVNCKYRMPVNCDVRQKNALRIELLPSNDYRCCADLRDDRIGGHWSDYGYCVN